MSFVVHSGVRAMSCCLLLLSSLCPVCSPFTVGSFVLVDISFRWSRLSTTGPRSEVDQCTYTDVEFALWAAALVRLSLAATPELATVPREASSLSRQLPADLADFPQRVCRTLGVATPRKGRGKRGGVLTNSVAPTHPPLSAHPWVFPFTAPSIAKLGREPYWAPSRELVFRYTHCTMHCTDSGNL